MIKQFFSLFKDSPNTFEGQRPDEHVLLLLRRHSFIIITRIALAIIAALVPLILVLTYSDFLYKHALLDISMFISCVWLMAAWLVIFYSLTLYTLNTVIITDERIVDNDQHGFFSREISELNNHRIQDVTVRTNGLIETMLEFGDVTVQTAAAEKQFIFCEVPDPEKVKDIIMQTTSSKHSGIKASV